MAESYRGLTIRIGGDTTKLSQALHSANQAISGTQSGLRKLNDALKMDPTSLKASQLQVGAFAEQASNAASRLTQLNTAMQQVGDYVPKGSTQTIREMADAWGNVQMKAAQTREYYNGLTKSLASINTEMTELSSKVAETASKKLGSNWTILTDASRMTDAMRELPSSVRQSEDAIQRYSTQVQKLQDRYSILTDKLRSYEQAAKSARSPESNIKALEGMDKTQAQIDKVIAKFEKLKSTFTSLSGTKFSYDESTTGLENLQAAIEEFTAKELMSADEAQKLWNRINALKEEFPQVKQALENANMVAQFTDLEAEATKAEAQVKSLVEQMLEAAKTSASPEGFRELEQQLQRINERGQEAKGRLSELLSAISHDVGATNTGLRTEAVKAYEDAIAAAEDKVAKLSEEINKLSENERVVELANTVKNLGSAAEEAEQSYRESATELATWEQYLSTIEGLMNKIKSAKPEDYEQDEDYQVLAKEAEYFTQAIKGVSATTDAAKKNMQDFSNALDLKDKRADLELIKSTLNDMGRIKPEVDLSGVEGLEKALKSISEGTFDSNGFSNFTKYVNTAGDALEDAKKKYQALTEAAKKDPTNSETLRQRTEAFDQVVEKTIAHIDTMKNAIAVIPADKIDQVALSTGTVSEAYTAAKQRVEDLKKALKSTEDQIKSLTEQQKKLNGSTDGLQDPKKIDELTERIKKLKEQRDELQKQSAQALDLLNTEENTRRIEQYTVVIQQDEAALHELGATARGVSEIKATPQIDEAAFVQVVDRIAQAARRMGSEITQASNEIDSAYRDMRKTVNGTEQDFENLRQAAIEYSQSSVTSADTMLEMQALGGQLGVLTEDLEQFGKITSNLDIATDINAEDVALKLGQISNVLGLDIEGMQGFSDALVRLGNNMPAQESAIMAVAQRFGAVASTASFSGDEILAWSAAIAATGQRSEAAATAISNTVSGIEQAVASGGSDLKQFAAIASMSAEEFKQSWQDSPTATLRAFIEGLKTLKDSDESAVAALENMGITGVRQQQTLLALTQTVDSLDKALVMSSDAWNGISDQWGQAGDAAIEAGKKSEGFSGSLAIMQNNAQNLAAALGDGLIPYMDAAAKIMQVVTDALNAMPAPVKVLLTGLGGVSIAFSTITPVLDIFGKGLANIIAIAGQSTSIVQFLSQIGGLESAFMAAAQEGVNLWNVLNGPVLLGITAAVGALAFAVSAIQEYNEQQENLRLATEGLATATQSASSSYANYISGAQESARSIKELKEAVDQTIESQANLAQQMSETWGEIGTSEAQVDMLVQKIGEFANKSGLSVTEQNELIAAVETFNNLTGHSVQVLDAENGQLDANVSTIEDYADAWKQATERSQHIEDYGNTLKQLAEDEAELKEINERLAESGTSQGDWFTDMRDGANSVSGSYSELAQRQHELESAIDSAKLKLQESVAGMGSLGNEVSTVESALQAAGHSLTDYGDLTDSELQGVIDAFNDSSDRSCSAVERVIRYLEALRSGANDASTIADQLEASSAATAKASAEAYKAQATIDYNATKASFDAQYKAAQRAYNAQYKAQQKAFDAEYKSQQKAFDKQYKALQKQLEKQYNERKKAYDAQLKALKKSQDAEVAAFKKATEAKLKEMKKEYEQRLKLLELEYEGKTGEVDERIKALEAETEAEKKAIEEREQAEKVAELQKAVSSAKSRRTRAEAEKALNDYLQELEADRNEESRKAQIEALEEQKDLLKDEYEERKAQLKEEYDAEVEAYKEMRAAKLAALQEANDAEYEKAKENLDAQLALLKEKQTERLEAMKEAQQAQLEALKEAQQAQLEAMKDAQSQALENMKADQTAQLQQLKADQDARYKQIKAGQDEEALAQKAANKEKQDEQDRSNSKMLSSSMHFLQTTHDKLEEALGKRASATSKSNEEIHDDTDDWYSKTAESVKTRSEEANEKIAKSYEGGKRLISDAVQAVSEQIVTPFTSIALSAWGWGNDTGSNLAEGLRSATRWVSDAVGGIVDTIWGPLHHSVPERGPLADDDEWGSDLVQNIIDGMRERERDLARQAEKMARILEDGFDPTLTVDAAYEALDTIGKNHSKSLGAIVETNSAPVVNVTLNMNLSDVSIRDDTDIEKLAKAMSQEMAAQAARQLAGRLG